MSSPEPESLLTPQEVAQLFRVDAKTVTRWAKAERIPTALRTLGGHRRYREADVKAAMNGTAECVKCHYPLGSSGHRVTCLGASS